MLLILSLCFTSFPPFIHSLGWGSIPLCWEPISHAVAEFRGPQLGVSSVRMRDGRKVLSVLLGAGGGVQLSKRITATQRLCWLRSTAPDRAPGNSFVTGGERKKASEVSNEMLE